MEYVPQHIPGIYYDEAQKHLGMILDWFRREYGDYDNCSAECLFSHSLILMKNGRIEEAMQGMQDAYNQYRQNLGDYDNKTVQVKNVIERIEEMYKQDWGEQSSLQYNSHLVTVIMS